MMDIDFYKDNGYLIFDTNIDNETISQIISTVQHENNQRVQDAWTINSYVRSVALNQTILQTVQTLYNKTPLPFQTLNFNSGTEQAIHSDTIHFNTKPSGNMCGVWVALEDITEDNGPLFFYPGSHKEPEMQMQDLKLENGVKDYYLYELIMQQLIDKKHYKKTLGIMKKGQAIIWAANLLHGGSKVADKKSTRYSQVTHYFFESEYYWTPILSNPMKRIYRSPTWIT